MKTVYYTVEKELQNVGDIEETTGYKDINVYFIENNIPKLLVTFFIKNTESSEEIIIEKLWDAKILTEADEETNFENIELIEL